MGVKSKLTLLVLAGLAGTGYYFRNDIKNAYADGKEKVIDLKDDLKNGSSNNDDNNANDATPDTPQLPPTPPPNQNSNKSQGKEYVYVPVYQNDGQSSLGDNTPKSEIIQAKTQPELEKAINKDRKKTTSTINKHSSPYAKNNVDAYAKQKYGIDYDKLKSAKGKTVSKRTVDERKQIEAEKARQIFDSRSISNW